ncbi:hypothetical protein ACN4EG_02760 [Alkalinema pantanalense CENA528]|uniref:hypothetical protein n=1 Tax=Alkalinema pantanalense TaxID=1620705 RepID=UPI003D700276
MSLQMRPPMDSSPVIHSSQPKCYLLHNRQQYRNCYITLADEVKPIAAIEYQDAYFSFFKTVADRSRADQLAAKLLNKGNSLVMVEIPRGVSLWIYEPDAQPVLRNPKQGSHRVSSAPIPVLGANGNYQPCQIQVPDLDKPLTGMVYDNQYYSLLRMVRDMAQAQSLAQRLVTRGNQALITESSYGYSVWVWEPDAMEID